MHFENATFKLYRPFSLRCGLFKLELIMLYKLKTKDWKGNKTGVKSFSCGFHSYYLFCQSINLPFSQRSIIQGGVKSTTSVCQNMVQMCLLWYRCTSFSAWRTHGPLRCSYFCLLLPCIVDVLLLRIIACPSQIASSRDLLSEIMFLIIIRVKGNDHRILERKSPLWITF